MTPAEHRAEAERLLEAAKTDVRDVDATNKVGYLVVMDRAAFAVACAGVHARLAAVPEAKATLADVYAERARRAVGDNG